MKQQSIAIKIFLCLILLFSIFINTRNINRNPPALYSDEADISYQAFIFNNCFSDYFGNKLPVHFHSFSDWQPGLYIYSVALIQKIIGHSDLAVRLPSAIFGTLTIFVFFLIILELIKKPVWALIGALLLTITPWLIHFSRTGFAVTSMLFFLLLGIYYWILFINKNKNKFLYFSIAAFAFSLYTYSTIKLYLILVFLIIFSLWFKKIISTPFKTKLIVIIIFCLISLPVVVDTIQGKAGYRFSYINIFSDPTVSDRVNHSRLEESEFLYGKQVGLKPSLISKVFYNKISQWSEMFSSNYFRSFSTEFLFISGDENLRQGFKTSGYLLYPDLFFLIIGIATVFKKNNFKNKKILVFISLCLITAPIPFSLTRDSSTAHGTRLILMLPFILIFSVLGIINFSSRFKYKLITPIILSVYLICFAAFYHQYSYRYPNVSARSWHTGMKESVEASMQNKEKWSRIYYSSNSYEPFMPFFLNYSNYQPNNNLKCSPATSLKWDNNNFFTGMQAENKYYLGFIEWSPLINSKPDTNDLFVVNSEDMIKIKNSIDTYNKANSKHVYLNINNSINKKFAEQEEFHLISFNYDK